MEKVDQEIPLLFPQELVGGRFNRLASEIWVDTFCPEYPIPEAPWEKRLMALAVAVEEV